MSKNALETLFRKFTEALVENADSKTFLPDSDLIRLLEEAEPNLKQCLINAQVDPLEHDEVLELIRHGGRKVFATLVLMNNHPVNLILKFMAGDQMLWNELDARLPFALVELNLILGDDHLAKLFYLKQWVLLSPLFKSDRAHREFEKHTILPFVHVDDIKNGQGGCGTVTRVTLHKTQHRFRQASNVTSHVSKDPTDYPINVNIDVSRLN